MSIGPDHVDQECEKDSREHNTEMPVIMEVQQHNTDQKEVTTVLLPTITRSTTIIPNPNEKPENNNRIEDISAFVDFWILGF